MDFISLVNQTIDSEVEFWRAVSIWLKNPHTVNRRILGMVKVFDAQINCEFSELFERFHEVPYNSFVVDGDLNENCAEKLTQLLNIPGQDILHSIDLVESPCDRKYLFVKYLIPRNPQLFAPTFQLTVVDKKEKSVFYFSKCTSCEQKSLDSILNYKIDVKEDRIITMYVQKLQDLKGFEQNLAWLKDKLFPRFVKWATNHSHNHLALGSLTLISIEKYANLYSELKTKYGPKLVKIWPEKTDPAKFVYEDIAIATYLLLLWEKEREEKNMERLQSFLDLGCGNGLLVYILTNQGHKGMGLDLRRRKIWDLYPNNIELKVSTIIPSSSSLFPEIDWLIGNHSDELTPWIPVIASRSSFDCRFFVLPCCAYEFDGSKYQRRNQISSTDVSKSQYWNYVCYVEEISKRCGFETRLDRLRIPSTKRICLIGWNRTYIRERWFVQDEAIESMINERSLSTIESRESSDRWNSNFKPREPLEKVRNCTQLNKELISDVVNKVASHLLRTINKIYSDSFEKPWNAGGELELSQIATFLPSEILKELRNECGGLQTLLKNNGHIFDVSKGRVRFRIPGNQKIRKKRSSKNIIFKTKVCWFYQNHPDGCPFPDTQCHFKH